MTATSLAVGPGTTVFGKLGVGPFAVSPAELLYADWLELAGGSRVFPMPNGGIGPCMGNYQSIERDLLEFAGGEMIDLQMHSQNCLHGARFMVRHRELVRKALFVNGPFAGAYLAEKFRGIPCAIDMRPGSRFLAELNAELVRAFKRFDRCHRKNPNYHVPECHFIGLKHDRIVPHGSPNPLLGSLATHHCIGGGACPPLEDSHYWHGVQDDPNHFNVVKHQPALELFAEILACDGRWADTHPTTVTVPAELVPLAA